MMGRNGALLAGLLLLATLTGCGDDGAVSRGEPELPASLPQVNMSTFTLPLDAYEPTDQQNRTMYEARNILIVRCMKKFGFTITPPGPGEPSPGGPNERRYLIHSEARAQTFGYKWPEITNQQRPPEPDLEPAARTAMSGDGASQISGVAVPEGGCLGEAARGLSREPAGDDESGFSLLRRLSNEAYSRMQNDSRVTAAAKRWSVCMRRAGFHYESPAQANNDPAFSGDVASPAEIATATADVKCKKETSLINVMAAVETAYQRRALEEHQERLRALTVQTQQEVKTAADVIAGRK